MATLNGFGLHPQTFKKEAKWFGITPVEPSISGPHDAYIVEFGPYTNRDTVRICGNVHGWQFNHSYFERIAEMFLCAAELAPLKHVKFATPALISGPDWLSIILCEASTRKLPNGVDLQVFVSAPDSPTNVVLNEKTPYQHRFMFFGLETTIDDAKEFGSDLKREIDSARAKRVDLGIETDEDRCFLRFG